MEFRYRVRNKKENQACSERMNQTTINKVAEIIKKRIGEAMGCNCDDVVTALKFVGNDLADLFEEEDKKGEVNKDGILTYTTNFNKTQFLKIIGAEE